MLITKAMIDAACSQGACDGAIAWLHEQPRTIAELAHKDGSWAEWAAERLLSVPVRRALIEAMTEARRERARLVHSAYRVYQEKALPAPLSEYRALAGEYNKAVEEADRAFAEALIIPLEQALKSEFGE